jgi:hypothetical protein
VLNRKCAEDLSNHAFDWQGVEWVSRMPANAETWTAAVPQRNHGGEASRDERPPDEESSAVSRYYLGAGTVQNGCRVATNSICTSLTKDFNQLVQSSIPACSEGTCPIRISAFFLP